MTDNENNEKQAAPAQDAFTVSVSVTFTKEHMFNMLTNGIEGGIGRWACLEEMVEPTEWKWLSEPGHHYYADYVLNPGGALVFSFAYASDDEEAAERYRLDWAAVQRGLEVLVKESPYHFSHIMHDIPFSDGGENTDNNDGILCDAITGDALIQCALLGHIDF